MWKRAPTHVPVRLSFFQAITKGRRPKNRALLRQVPPSVLLMVTGLRGVLHSHLRLIAFFLVPLFCGKIGGEVPQSFTRCGARYMQAQCDRTDPSLFDVVFLQEPSARAACLVEVLDRNPRRTRLMSTSSRNSSSRKLRHCTFPHSVRCSPPLHSSTQFLGVSRLKAPSRVDKLGFCFALHEIDDLMLGSSSFRPLSLSTGFNSPRSQRVPSAVLDMNTGGPFLSSSAEFCLPSSSRRFERWHTFENGFPARYASSRCANTLNPLVLRAHSYVQACCSTATFSGGLQSSKYAILCQGCASTLGNSQIPRLTSVIS